MIPGSKGCKKGKAHTFVTLGSAKHGQYGYDCNKDHENCEGFSITHNIRRMTIWITVKNL